MLSKRKHKTKKQYKVEDIKHHPFAKFIDGDKLNLSQQELSDTDIPEVMCLLELYPKVKKIDLSLNNIGDAGIVNFVEKNQTIVEANFCGNTISDRGVISFAFKNQFVKHVDFSHNLISMQGINHFAKENNACISTKFSTIQIH